MKTVSLLLVLVAVSFGQTSLGGSSHMGGSVSTSDFGSPQQAALIIGQSLAAGGGTGVSAISTSQPYSNTMFSSGVLYPSTLTAYAPLVEGSPGPDRETLASGFANQLTAWDSAQSLFMSDWAIDGQAYSALKKGGSGPAYADSLTSVTYTAAHLPLGKTSFRYGATLCVHGEANASDVNYAADLLQWQTDYETDIKSATGQSGSIPMLVSQWQADGPNLGQFYDAYIANPNKVILVGPKYFLPHSDSLHLTSPAYITLGEYYAKVYRQAVLNGQSWTPLRPLTATRSTNVITLTYTGRVGNLILDTTTVTNLPDGNFGFTYSDNATHTITIASVAITDAANGIIQLTLSGTPNGSGGTLTYAATSNGAGGEGPVTGQRGCVRDSDPTSSRDGQPLYNWAINWKAFSL